MRLSVTRLARSLRRGFLGPLAANDERLLLAIGHMESRTVRSRSHERITDAEFQIFSQWGEDGIIQYLTSAVPIAKRRFVEFGVGDYRESNTRFLLQHDYWEGLILDSGTAHIDFINESPLRWRHTIEARSAFLTRANINQIIGDAGMSGDIGLLSIDVDGNDYWLLEAIDVVSPRIVVIEYNSLFGPRDAVVVPYRDNFTRERAHWSQLYYGASLSALHHLAVSRGFSLVGCSLGGVNAFFVREELLGPLRALTPQEAFVQRQHREARDQKGRLVYVSDAREQLGLIADLEVVDVVSGHRGTVRDLVPVDGVAT